MIPKIIHYCWFGRGPKNDLALRCIQSWKTFLPDYVIKEWNEDNFDLSMYQYVAQAYDNRKFAFVTDVVRLFALYTEGGIYMDTDVEVLKSFDPFLHHIMFSGFETDGFVPTGMMAAQKGSLWAKELLEQYKERQFVMPDGSFDMTTNTKVITKYMVEKGLILNNKYQDIPNLCTMYPADYFCPKDHTTGKIHLTQNSVCIHHFAGSWADHSFVGEMRHGLKVFLASVFGEKLIAKLSDVVTLRIFK